MSDNLKLIKEKIILDIDPSGAPGSILAENHQAILFSLLEKAGKYTGIPYKSKLNPVTGVVGSGFLVWNGNAMNNENDFVMTINTSCSDNYGVEKIFSIISVGSILQFKDFTGRVSHFTFKGYLMTTDSASNPVIDITLRGFSDNLNYTYQIGETEDCVLSFYPKTGEAVSVNSSEVRIGNLWFYPPNEADPQLITTGQEFRGQITDDRFVVGTVIDATDFDIDDPLKARLFIDNEN
tara:strand:- start:8367 stop:9077 length:711 start_codon:yes stop_codon:yes gene_type:complete